MTKITIDRAVAEQALHVATVAGYPVALIAALKTALAEPAEPVANNPDPYHLSRILHELAGSVSMCWEHVDRAGVFQSTQAAEFVAAAIAEIRQRTKETPPPPPAGDQENPRTTNMDKLVNTVYHSPRYEVENLGPRVKQALAVQRGLSTPEDSSVVRWGVDWGVNGDRSCVSIIKKHPDGVLEVVAVEYGPEGSAPPQVKPLTDEEVRHLLEAEFLGGYGMRSWDDDLMVFRLAETAYGIGAGR